MPEKRGYRVKNARKVSNLAVLFALYPRFYAIKSTYESSEYRFLVWVGFQAALILSTIGSLKYDSVY